MPQCANWDYSYFSSIDDALSLRHHNGKCGRWVEQTAEDLTGDLEDL